MGYGDLVFLTIMGLLVGLLALHYFGPKKRQRYDDYGDNGDHMRPERNDDGQGGGGLH